MNRENSILLETRRTLVRSFRYSDRAQLEKMMSDPDVMRYTGFRQPQSASKVQDNLEKWIQPGSNVWCVQEKQTEDFVGWFMLKDTGYEFPELGFMLTRKKWNQGFSTEVASKILHYAFTRLGYAKVMATTVAQNEASVSVLKKIGMSPSSIIPRTDLEFEILSYEVNSGTFKDN